MTAVRGNQHVVVAESDLVNHPTKITWKVGLVGLGKLGVPVALAMSLRGHDFMGYDVDESKMQKARFPHRERGPIGEPSLEPLLQQSALRFGPLPEVAEHAEIIFVAVQTPSDPLCGGVTRLPAERGDFDYTFPRPAIENLSAAIVARGREKIVVIPVGASQSHSVRSR
jgi:UDPglucose 6-dehydrogenase